MLLQPYSGTYIDYAQLCKRTVRCICLLCCIWDGRRREQPNLLVTDETNQLEKETFQRSAVVHLADQLLHSLISSWMSLCFSGKLFSTVWPKTKSGWLFRWPSHIIAIVWIHWWAYNILYCFVCKYRYNRIMFVCLCCSAFTHRIFMCMCVCTTHTYTQAYLVSYQAYF